MTHFWKSYIGDKGRLVFNLVCLVFFASLFYLFVGKSALIFVLGYILFDPVSYYIVTYRKQVTISRHIKNIIDNQDNSDTIEPR